MDGGVTENLFQVRHHNRPPVSRARSDTVAVDLQGATLARVASFIYWQKKWRTGAVEASSAELLAV